MARKKKSKFDKWLRRKCKRLVGVIKKFGAMNLILVIIAISVLVFTVEMVQLFRDYGAVPDTLITSFFMVIGGECGVMGWIKTSKERYRDRKNELEDRAYYEKKGAPPPHTEDDASMEIPCQQEVGEDEQQRS